MPVVQGMASSMGGSPLAPSASPHGHQPGQYRGAAGLDVQNGTVLFAGYGAPAALRPPTDRSPTANGGSESQLHFRQLSNGSDGIVASSPLSRCVSGTAGQTDHAAAHSRSSSGWTGFDGPSYAFAGGLNGIGTATAVPAVGVNFADYGSHGTPTIESLLTSLEDAWQHSDLRMHLQKTSLGGSDFGRSPHDSVMPSVVNESLCSGQDGSFAPPGAFGMQPSGVLTSNNGVGHFRTEDEALPRDLIGNLDLYL